MKFDEMMREFAEARGEKFLEENERLKGDSVPEEVRQKALELIERSFDEDK